MRGRFSVGEGCDFVYELMNGMDGLNGLMKFGNHWVEAVGDCPNLEIHVSPDDPFWKTISRNNSWKCQQSIFSRRVRVISPSNVQMANGSRRAMLEKMGRLADGEFLRRGDMIGVSRNGLYEHYAIYIGKGRVIHYCGAGADFGGEVTIHEAPFSEFLKDSKTFFLVWFDEGRPVKIRSSTSFLQYAPLDVYDVMFQRKQRRVFTAEETVQRAQSRLGEENYNPVTNNCEHFAMWCRTGIAESGQVKKIMKTINLHRVS